MPYSFRILITVLLLYCQVEKLEAIQLIVSPTDDVQAVIDGLLPGDTLLLSAGIYRGPFEIDINGALNAPIVLMSLSLDDPAIVDGGAQNPGIDLQNYWLSFENSSWVVIQQLQFQNGWTDPIQVFNSSYLSFKQCDFVGGRRVIRARGPDTHHILVENCFWDQGGRFLWDINRWMSRDAWEEMHSGALRFSNGSLFASEGTIGGHVIRGNIIQHAFNALRWRADQGMDTNIEIYENKIEYIRDNDFEPEDYTNNLFIHHNRSHNIHKTLSVDNVNGGNIYYFGNTVTTDVGGRAQSIATGIYKIYGVDQNISDPLYIFNNSYFGTGRVHGGVNGRTIANIVHLNNAFELTRREWALDQWDETLVYDHDCSNEPFPQVLKDNGQQANGIVALPGFIDGTVRNLRLTDESPCIDAGTVISIPELSWELKFKGSAPDIGAFDGNEPIMGPFFRVEAANMEERPRITLVSHDQDSTNLSFSAPLVTETVAGNIFPITASGNQAAITNYILKNNGHTVRFPSPTDPIIHYSVSNNLFGENGREATNWANDSQFEAKEDPDLSTVLLYTPEGGRIAMNTDRRILKKGTEIELLAVADPGYKFVEWLGDVRGVQHRQLLTVDGSIWAIAVFEEILLTSSIPAPDVSIYPNPSSGMIRITGDEIVNLNVTDLTGEIVYSTKRVKANELDLSHLSSGLYMISFESFGKSVIRKLIINQ